MENILPKGWVAVQLIELLKVLENGSRPIGGVQGILEGIPSLGGEHLNSDGGFKFETIKYVPIDFAEKMQRGRILSKDILIVKDGATTGKTSFVADDFPYKMAYVNEHVFICRPHQNISSKCLYYYLRSKEGQERILSNFTGSAQGGINQKFANNTLIPLPPLPTQQRIVAKLDSLFARIDQMKSSMERIPQLLKAFRQSVLTQAVTGKLTEEWREGKELEEWKTYPLSDISESKLGKMLDQKKNIGIQTKYLRNINVRWFSFDLNDLQEMKAQQDELKKYKIENGDVLICEGGEPGRAAIWSGESSNLIFQKALHRVRMNSNVLPEILVYNLKVDSENNTLNQLFTGTTIKHLTGKSLSNYEIEVPPLEEQQEIVRQVESLFAKADRIDAQYQSLKAKIEQLPQALLAKAFRGELVEQLPEDGDARELLEALRQAQRPGKGEMERRGIPHSGTGKKENVKPKSEKILRRAQDDTVLKQVAEPEGKYWGKK